MAGKNRENPAASIIHARHVETAAAARFVARCSTIIYETVNGSTPLYRSDERGWSAAHVTFYIRWRLIRFLGLLTDGPVSGRLWGSGTILTAEFYSIRVRGAGNGFA
jgi:hypothetical protein